MDTILMIVGAGLLALFWVYVAARLAARAVLKSWAEYCEDCQGYL